MIPSFLPGDVVLSVRVRDPSEVHLGDVVVFRVADRTRGLTIKRFVAGPGHPYAELGLALTPPGMCVVRSDNAPQRGDRRAIGPLPLAWIESRVIWGERGLPRAGSPSQEHTENDRAPSQ